jgi:cholesterol transport system auxiliary component
VTRRRAFLAAGLLFAVVGCGGPAERDHFYVLQAPEPTARLATPRLKGNLVVGNFAARGLLLERAVLYWQPDAPRELQQYRNHLWNEPPARLVDQTLAQFLRNANLAETVTTPDTRAIAGYAAFGTVLRFEHRPEIASPSVAIELEISLVRAEDRQVVLLKRYADGERVAGPAIGDVVLAFERALQRIYQHFVDDVPRP